MFSTKIRFSTKIKAYQIQPQKSNFPQPSPSENEFCPGKSHHLQQEIPHELAVDLEGNDSPTHPTIVGTHPPFWKRPTTGNPSNQPPAVDPLPLCAPSRKVGTVHLDIQLYHLSAPEWRCLERVQRAGFFLSGPPLDPKTMKNGRF